MVQATCRLSVLPCPRPLEPILLALTPRRVRGPSLTTCTNWWITGPGMPSANPRGREALKLEHREGWDLISSLQPTLAVNSQLQAISAHHIPHIPTPRPLTSPTQPIPLLLWGLAKAPWVQLPRGTDIVQSHTVLLSGQDPHPHARWLTRDSH